MQAAWKDLVFPLQTQKSGAPGQGMVNVIGPQRGPSPSGKRKVTRGQGEPCVCRGLTHIVILISPFNLSSLCSAPSFGKPSGLLFQAASFQKPKPSPGSLPLFVIYLWGGWGTCLRKEREWGLIFP